LNGQGKNVEPKVQLLVVFNHRYESNLEKLDSVYRDRFHNVLYLMPFYEGRRLDVITVYDSSWCFGNFLSQASRLISADFAQYVVVADDMVLNPDIDETNLCARLGLAAGCGYIKTLVPITRLWYLWLWHKKVIDAFRRSGVEYEKELPAAEDAESALNRYGLQSGTFGLHNLIQPGRSINIKDAKYFMKYWPFLVRLILSKAVPYPLVASYADFAVIPGAAWKQFVKICGVLSSLNLFSEVAIPTAMMLACSHVQTEIVPGHTWEEESERQPDAKMRGVELWNVKDVQGMESKYGNDLDRLLASFAPDQLYVHPVKLSKWRKK
jgi:hypothetical protein